LVFGYDVLTGPGFRSQSQLHAPVYVILNSPKLGTLTRTLAKSRNKKWTINNTCVYIYMYVCVRERETETCKSSGRGKGLD